jgi:hypothetical protein
MPRIASPDNVRIEQAIVAVARAHAHYPGTTPAAVMELVTKIEPVLSPYQGAVCTMALCVLLLKSLGFVAPFDTSRLRPQ